MARGSGINWNDGQMDAKLLVAILHHCDVKLGTAKKNINKDLGLDEKSQAIDHRIRALKAVAAGASKTTNSKDAEDTNDVTDADVKVTTPLKKRPRAKKTDNDDVAPAKKRKTKTQKADEDTSDVAEAEDADNEADTADKDAVTAGEIKLEPFESEA